MSRRLRWWMPALLFTAVLVLYGPSVRYDLLRWDDIDYVTENPALLLPLGDFLGQITTTFVPAAHGDYLPVTLTSYRLEFGAVGTRAWLYHLDNALLYGAGCVALWWVLRRITGRDGLALLVALLFAAHPLNTEAVAWVSERKTVLSFLLSTAALLLVIPPAGSKRVSWKRHVGSIALYGLACLSKSAVVFFPLLIFAHRWIVRRESIGRSVLASMPYALVSMATACGRVQGHELSGQAGMTPFHADGAYHLSVHVLTVLSILGKYATSILIPIGLNHCYPLEVVRTAGDPHVWIGLLVLLMAIGGVVLLRRTVPVASFGLVWFLGGWLPHAQIIPVPPALRADRYMFFALPGLILFLVVLIERACRAREKPGRKWILGGIGVTAIVVLAALASVRSRVWADDRSLWADSLEKAPDSAIANSFLGYVLLDEMAWDEAERHFRRALASRERNFMALNGLAMVHAQRGDLTEAVRLLQESLDDPQAPPDRRGQTLALIGKYELVSGRLDESLAAYGKAAELRPFDHTVLSGYALTLSISGRSDAALPFVDRALALSPDDSAAWYVRAFALTDLGRLDEALVAVRRCIDIDAQHALAYEQGGKILAQQRRWTEAERYLEQAVRLLPDNREAAGLLEQVRAEIGKRSNE